MFSGIHMNKDLYSLSYTCVTAGTAGIVLIGFYILVLYSLKLTHSLTSLID